MAQVILNGDFSAGFDYWYNWNYVLDAGRIKRSSNAGDANENIGTVEQTFAVNDQVIDAKITAWRRYESVSGGVSNGYVRSRAILIKPDLTSEDLCDETKTALTGEGNILNNVDITSKFTQQGNYKLRLKTYVASAKNESQTSISNTYTTWINNGFTVGTYECFRLSNSDNDTEVYSYIYKEFTVDAACHYGLLSVNAKGIVQAAEYLGYARFTVKLGKVGETPTTLYDGYLDDSAWHTILNNLDIHSYLSSSGTYRLTLEARVKSSKDSNPDPPPDWLYLVNEARYGTLSLVAKWYTYSVSNGFWDNISLDIKIKKFKTVFESLEASDVPQKKISVSNTKEDLEMAESYSTRSFIGKVVSEILELKEWFSNKVFKTIKEDLEATEAWYSIGHYQKDVKEDIDFGENYSMILKKPKQVKEDFELIESYSAKKTAGNIETTYLFGEPTEWQPISPTATPWIKEKIIIGAGG
jgi:hypothetical protein